MTPETLWLVKLVMAHLLTDFLLQPTTWIADRRANKIRSSKLYLHGFITAITAWLFIGFDHWLVALVILISHILIDAWKSYQPDKLSYFIIDQLLHLTVIVLCWYFTFFDWDTLSSGFTDLTENASFWTISAAVILLTTPAGILIGQFTRQWREKIADAEGLANAGKWIGITERIIVFILVMYAQYSAIGLLVTAKGIIRFSEKDRQEIKTEYLVVGTLSSIGMAIITGILTKALIAE